MYKRQKKEYALSKGAVVNTVMLQEDISRGQRVEKFSVEVRVNGEWKLVAEGSTIGYKRLLRFPDMESDCILSLIHILVSFLSPSASFRLLWVR